MPEVRQVRLDIEGEAVHRHMSGHANADRRNLALVGPHAGEPWIAPRLHTKRCQGSDQDLFERPDVRDNSLRVEESQNRIPDHLARSVIRDIAAPIDIEALCSELCKVGFRGKDVGSISVAPDGVHMRVFNEKQIVALGSSFSTTLPEGLLEIPCLFVRQPSEPACSEQFCVRYEARGGAHVSCCSQSQLSRLSLIRRRNSTAVEPSNAL